MINRSADPKRKLIRSIFLGNISVTEVIDYHLSIVRVFEPGDTVFIYNDLRKCKFDFEIHDLPIFIETMTMAASKYEMINSVYLTDDPIVTAFMAVYELKVSHIRNYHICHCSTEKQALELMKPLDLSRDTR